jgi:hypothetical protein
MLQRMWGDEYELGMHDCRLFGLFRHTAHFTEMHELTTAIDKAFLAITQEGNKVC